MRLPNAELAVVPAAKLVDYLLSVRHPYGRSKARFFASLGYWAVDPEPLRSALITLACETDMEEIPFYSERSTWARRTWWDRVAVTLG